MVRRVFGLVYKEVSNLHQAAYVLAIFAFGSQLLALVRDRMLASQFGADTTLDLYYAAFRIPDLLYVLFASTLSVYVLLPFLAERVSQGSHERARVLLSQIMTLFLSLYTVLAIGLALVAPTLLAAVFPNITDQATLTILTKILLLQPVLLGLSSLFGVVTQYQHRFIIYAISPLLYNVGIIIGIAYLYPIFGLPGVVFGVVLGALAHVGVQIPFVWRSQLRFGITWQFEWRAVGRVVRSSLPRALTLSCNQITLLALVSLASGMIAGSVAVFQFAFNLQSVPLAIIGASYSVAAFPTLARLYAKQDLQTFSNHIETALRHIVFWSIPVIGLCIVLRAQLVRVILGTGAFNWEDTRLTAAVFAVLIISLVAHGINLLLVRALYAGGDTKSPLYISGVGTLVTVVSAYLLHAVFTANAALQTTVAEVLRLQDVAGAEVLMIAVAYTAGLWLQTIGFVWLVETRYALSWREPIRVSVQSLLAGASGSGAAYFMLQLFVTGFDIDTFWGVFAQGALAGLVGVAVVIITYALVHSAELREVSRALSRKIFKTDVVGSERHVL